MNDNIEYEKFAQEIYNEILKNLYVKNIEVMHNVKLIGKSGQKHQICLLYTSLQQALPDIPYIVRLE